MRVRLITEKITEYVSRRKFNFFLTTVIITMALYMLSMVLQISFRSTYYITDTKRVFSDKNIINVNILATGQEGDGYYVSVGSFLDEMNKTYGEKFGKFMYLTANYTVDGAGQKLDTLYLDDSMFGLCNVDFITDKSAGKFTASEGTLLKGYVCESILSEYPVGTVLENNNTGTKTVIVGYYGTDSYWAPGLLLHDTDSTVSLNDYVVSVMDGEYFDMYAPFYANIFNCIYVKMADGASADTYKEEIKSIADKCGIKCYINTLDELIQNEKDENGSLLKALGIMVFFSVFVALTGILASLLSDVSSWQGEIAVMYINGVAPVDVFLIILFENLIKSVLGINIAVYLYGHGFNGLEHTVYFHMVVPVLVVGTLVCISVFSYIAYKSVRQDRLITILGGERL